MNHYLFVLESCNDIRTLEVTTTDFKHAVLIAAEKLYENDELFMKCVKGFDEDDMKGIVDLFNHFACTHIIRNVYLYTKKFNF